MRALIRSIINLTLIVAAVTIDARLTTEHAYQHASRDGRIAMLVAPVAAAFVIACILLYLIPSKTQLKKRKQAKQPAPAYATPSKRR